MRELYLTFTHVISASIFVDNSRSFIVIEEAVLLADFANNGSFVFKRFK